MGAIITKILKSLNYYNKLQITNYKLSYVCYQIIMIRESSLLSDPCGSGIVVWLQKSKKEKNIKNIQKIKNIKNIQKRKKHKKHSKKKKHKKHSKKKKHKKNPKKKKQKIQKRKNIK